MTKVNLSAIQYSSLTQPFFSYGDDLSITIPVTPGTVAAGKTYTTSVTTPMDRPTSVQMLVQLNFSDSLWYTTLSYYAQALPNWTAAAQTQELDFSGYFSGNNFITKIVYFNLSASPITVASFNVNVIVKRFLTPFQAA